MPIMWPRVCAARAWQTHNMCICYMYAIYGFGNLRAAHRGNAQVSTLWNGHGPTSSYLFKFIYITTLVDCAMGAERAHTHKHRRALFPVGVRDGNG